MLTGIATLPCMLERWGVFQSQSVVVERWQRSSNQVVKRWQSSSVQEEKLAMFGVLFPNRSFPLDINTFAQVDDHRWLLDMNYFVGEAYDQIKEMCLFLLTDQLLPPGKALAVYVQSPGSPFEYRGAVHNSCPSAVIPLLWPANSGQLLLMPAGSAPLTAQIGVSVEDLASLPLLNLGQQKRVEEMAIKVGENLFNFMQSFCSVEAEKLVVPMDILNRWFKKFQDRAKLDPDFLNRFTV